MSYDRDDPRSIFDTFLGAVSAAAPKPGAHEHATANTRQGSPTPLYHFCACGFVRVVWPSGRSIDWHKPSAEKAGEARAIDAEERTKARGES